MAIRKIRYIGDDVLGKPCKPVKKMTPSLQVLIEDMFETMYDANGVGLAAPQVGILRRICVIDVMDDNPFVLINPEILETSGEQTDDEGCLSVPGIHESVKRPVKIHVKYTDENLKEHDEWIDGFLARVFQHEYDHLDGKLFVDHLSTFRKQLIKSKLVNMTKGKFSASYKCKANR